MSLDHPHIHAVKTTAEETHTSYSRGRSHRLPLRPDRPKIWQRPVGVSFGSPTGLSFCGWSSNGISSGGGETKHVHYRRCSARQRSSLQTGSTSRRQEQHRRDRPSTRGAPTCGAPAWGRRRSGALRRLFDTGARNLLDRSSNEQSKEGRQNYPLDIQQVSDEPTAAIEPVGEASDHSTIANTSSG